MTGLGKWEFASFMRVTSKHIRNRDKENPDSKQ